MWTIFIRNGKLQMTMGTTHDGATVFQGTKAACESWLEYAPAF